MLDSPSRAPDAAKDWKSVSREISGSKGCGRCHEDGQKFIDDHLARKDDTMPPKPETEHRIWTPSDLTRKNFSPASMPTESHVLHADLIDDYDAPGALIYESSLGWVPAP